MPILGHETHENMKMMFSHQISADFQRSLLGEYAIFDNLNGIVAQISESKSLTGQTVIFEYFQHSCGHSDVNHSFA